MLRTQVLETKSAIVSLAFRAASTDRRNERRNTERKEKSTNYPKRFRPGSRGVQRPSSANPSPTTPASRRRGCRHQSCWVLKPWKGRSRLYQSWSFGTQDVVKFCSIFRDHHSFVPHHTQHLHFCSAFGNISVIFGSFLGCFKFVKYVLDISLKSYDISSDSDILR